MTARTQIEFVTSMDGYNKLRPYGFEIHGCIDIYIAHRFYSQLLYDQTKTQQTYVIFISISPYFQIELLEKLWLFKAEKN